MHRLLFMLAVHGWAKKAAPTTTQCLLCDIDGSLIHYPDVLQRVGTMTVDPDAGAKLEYTRASDGRRAMLLALPPSSTGMRGLISERTLELASAIRAKGAAVAIISGARWATVESRLPFLPEADAVVSDNGGRIFWRGAGGGAGLVEDRAWRARVAAGGAIGPLEENELAPAARTGALWELYRELTAAGWACDANGYAASFRVKFPQPNTTLGPAALAPTLGALGARGLASFGNLGCVDILPAASGKRNAGLYLVARVGARPETTSFLCDDDNDLELAAAVSEALLPQCTATSVRDAVDAADGAGFFVASVAGTFGTEECLERVLGRAAAAETRAVTEE